MANPSPKQPDPEVCVEIKKTQIECPLHVPVLGTTPGNLDDAAIEQFATDIGPHIIRDPLAHLSPEDRESARRLNEALAEDHSHDPFSRLNR